MSQLVHRNIKIYRMGGGLPRDQPRYVVSISVDEPADTV